MIRLGLKNGVWIRSGDRKPGIVVQTCDPSAGEAESLRSV